MSKYIIKNCPACCEYTQTYCCEDNYDHGRDTYCELIDNCIMKQIVDMCKEESSIIQHKQKVKVKGLNKLADRIFELLDIQEVE